MLIRDWNSVISKFFLDILNILGWHVKTVVDAPRRPRHYSEAWRGEPKNGKTAPPGLFIAQLTADHFEQRIKLILVK